MSVLYRTVQYRYRTVPYPSTVPVTTQSEQYGTVPYAMVQYCTVRYSTVRYGAGTNNNPYTNLVDDAAIVCISKVVIYLSASHFRYFESHKIC